MTDEFKQTILDWEKAISLFQEREELFQSELWDKFMELLDNTRLKMFEQFENGNGETGNSCCMKAKLKLISELKDTPKIVREAIRDLQNGVKELEKCALLQEVAEQSLD